MKTNLKSERGAVTLIVLVGMLFLTTFLMGIYISTANKAQTSAETTNKIREKYNNIEEAEEIYSSYLTEGNVIPIYTREHLEKVGSGEQIEVNGKIYIFAPNAIYTIQNDLDLGAKYDETTKQWSAENPWTPLPSTFTGILDGLGHTITGLYINDVAATNQGLFGLLKGTVKNLNIAKSYIKAKNYVGSIAGKNEGTIENCYNTGSIIGETNVTGGYFKSITTGEQIEVWSDKILDENVYFVSGSYTATAPKGFKVSKGVLEQTITDGLVIQDRNGNEFVWIPVEVTATDLATNIASFYRSDWISNGRGTTKYTSTTGSSFNEPLVPGGYVNEASDYNEMLKSVYNNKGFYIGRYEAGTTTPRTNKANGTTEMVVKRDAYPYNYVGWGLTMSDYTSDVTEGSKNQGKGALYLSKHMYDGEDIGAISTLCYGIQWDAMLDYIKDDTHNVTNGTTWGNYYDNTWTITRTTARYTTSPSADTTWKLIDDEENNKKEKTASGSILLTTGADDSFAAKNIYDVAGNVMEWTNEAYSSDYRVSRGGLYSYDGSSRPASHRSYCGPFDYSYFIGFRPALYIK